MKQLPLLVALQLKIRGKGELKDTVKVGQKKRNRLGERIILQNNKTIQRVLNDQYKYKYKSLNLRNG
jgi:hypothetical protein